MVRDGSGGTWWYGDVGHRPLANFEPRVMVVGRDSETHACSLLGYPPGPSSPAPPPQRVGSSDPDACLPWCRKQVAGTAPVASGSSPRGTAGYAEGAQHERRHREERRRRMSKKG